MHLGVDLDARPNARRRLYDARWQEARAKYLRERPICVLCNKPVKVRSHRGDPLVGVVNHKIPHRGDVRLFWDRLNWETQHKGCHDSVQQSYEHTGVMRGCDQSGVPLDSGHHWRAP